MYNDKKIVSSVNGARKSRNLQVKEWNWNIFSHHIQRPSFSGFLSALGIVPISILHFLISMSDSSCSQFVFP